MTGLLGDTAHRFGIRAVNVNGPGPESALVSVTTLGDVVANAGVDRFGVTRGTTVSLNGTGATYLWTQVSGNPAGAQLRGGQPWACHRGIPPGRGGIGSDLVT